MKIRNWVIALALVPVFAMADMTAEQRKAEFNKLDWHTGPRAESIASKATLKTPSDKIQFLDDKNSRRFLELTGNLPEDGNYTILDMEGGWWATFSFDQSGYVKEGDKIDADALLKTLKDSDGPANEERKRLGMGALYTEGWYVPPHYDEKTKQLEWGLKVRSDNGISLNYTIRLLGRSGVMSATLVSSPETLDADVASFRKVLTGFDYNDGEKYSEFKPGDHVAEFGLAALVTGGAAVIATKKGFWAAAALFLAKMWKLVAVGGIAVLAGLKSLFKKKESSN
ncbi:Uncharacterized membrane-anchored protein [Duganella sp. CF458]|uniref:DUF2167 domain-containing protein n=1 Tax=Duganella sp. CF458 TaxID=1884368 RepID=UPI0008E3F960|nr:DUF2167 domain-containing protein [Duganella sp. CF458]SFG84374.1 Uncharacterized membrane-anchored protein [Duganella sp. CF458]